MLSYEWLFVQSLHAKLKERIVGKIFITVTKYDTLYIKIESFGGLTYDCSFRDFAYKIQNGYSTDYAVYEIVNDYKRFILTKYLV